MNTKKSWGSKIRGWFPSDPVSGAVTQKPKSPAQKAPPTLNDRLVGGLGAAGGGLILSAIIFSFVPEYPKQVLIFLPIAGVSLLTAACLIWRKDKNGTQGQSI